MARKKTPKYTVTDGKMVLHLEPAEEGGYLVSCPFDPELITEADTFEEAFVMAYDAADLLRKGRRDLARYGSPKARRKPAGATG